MLQGTLARRGYVRWFHVFRGIQPESGEVRTFFVEYQILNPGIGGDEVQYGQHPYFKKRNLKPSYIQVKAGIFPDSSEGNGLQISNCNPVNSIQYCLEPFVFQTKECFYSETRIYGCVETSESEANLPYLMSDAGFMEWDLKIHKAVACDMGFVTSPLACAVGVLSDFWHAEGMRAYYSGHISLNGTVYEVEPSTCYGFADKSWGKKTNRPLVLFTSSHLVSAVKNKEYKNSAFAVRGCFPKLFFIPLKRRLMIQLTHMGEDFEFHFASIRNMSRCRWNTKETKKRFIWHIKAQNKNAVIKISISCTKKELMELLYEDTSGEIPQSPVFCGANGLGAIEIYRKQGNNLTLIDKLSVEDALCTYGK